MPVNSPSIKEGKLQELSRMKSLKIWRSDLECLKIVSDLFRFVSVMFKLLMNVFLQ